MKLLACLLAVLPSIAFATGGTVPAPKPVQKVTTINKSNNVSVNPSFHDETNVSAGASAAAGAYGGYVGTVGNSLNVEAVRNAPDVLAYPTAPCRVAIGGSAAFAGFGGGLSGSVLDENCSRIETSRQLYNLGQKEAAVQIMCLSAEAHKALTAVGVACKLKPDVPADPIKP